MRSKALSMRSALIVLCALTLNASVLGRAWAAQVCAWIVESIEADGAHKFELDLSADAPVSAAVRFQGPGFMSASMGGDVIQLDPGESKSVDDEGFDVSPGDDLRFDVQLYDHPIASLDEMHDPTGKVLAGFVFQRQAGAGGRPADFARQCKPLS
jgi:hypothetical protein